jgi:predicted GIY-YIG superfamily endonuclease
MACLIIYALQLEQGKYYIGKTHRSEGSELRFQEHLSGRGSEWTKFYKPISIIESYEHHSTFEEDVLTKKYMMKYGIENVRGGSYTKIDLEEWQVKSLEHEFKSVNDKCFKCGKSGHFAKDCGKGKYLEYLSKFETEEKIEEEIKNLDNIRNKVSQLKVWIEHFKYVKIRLNNRTEIKIEIEPSIIDTYNMRNLKWSRETMMSLHSKQFTEVTNEILYLKLCSYQGDGNKVNIVNDENVVENIYKIYIYRKRLERQYLEVFDNILFDKNPDAITPNELTIIINKKIELLYEKLAHLI